MISIKNLNFTYPRSDKLALENIDLTIDGGTIFGLIGPNGAGKTTLLSLLTGLNRANKRTITIDGHCIQANPQKVKRISGYIPQDYAFYPSLSAKENLLFFAGAQGLSGTHKQQRIDYCLDFCQLQEYANQKSATYSGGLKRRLNIAIGLLTDPQILYFDEPTVGIDPQSRAFILDKIKNLQQQGKTIIYTSHYMEEVEQLCDQIAIIDHGRICISGALNELKQSGNTTLKVQTQKALSGSENKELASKFSMTKEGSQLTFENIPHIEKVNSVLSTIAAMDVEVSGINYGSHNLEELFMTVTKRDLRD